MRNANNGISGILEIFSPMKCSTWYITVTSVDSVTITTIKEQRYNPLALCEIGEWCSSLNILQAGEVIQEAVPLNVIKTMIDLWFTEDD